VVWRHDFQGRFEKTSPQYGTAMSPLVLDGMCIAHVGGAGKGAIVAFDAATGKERWRWDGDGPAYASPVVGKIGGVRQLITQTQFHAVGLAPADGKLLWRLPYKTNFDQNSVTPVVFGNRVILSGYHLGTIAYRLDGDEPERMWKSRKVSMYMSTPVLKGDRFFGFSEKRRGQFVCVDANTGKMLWSGDGRQGENAALLDGGDVILALNTRAELIVFRASDEAYDELARYTVAETPTWAHPVVSGRTIHVKDLKSLTQWKLP
jgi:outer membrane protein assembly factor BamB